MYEAILIYKPHTDEELSRYALLQALRKIGIPKLYIHDMGIKKLAYTQKGYDSGYYRTFLFNCDKTTKEKVETYLKENCDIIKWLIMPCDDDYKQSTLSEYEQITLDNKTIDAMDVMLGLTSYVK